MLINRAVRNVSLLSMCQALGQTQMVLIFSVSGIIGLALGPVIRVPAVDLGIAQFNSWDLGLSTLPISLQFTFMMLSTVPAAFLMKRVGRANGFIVFLAIGFSGAALSLFALFERDFFLFCVGSALFGMSAGSNQQFRFAAVDTADDHFKSKAVSFVLAGGVFAGIAGPTLSTWSFDMLAPVIYGGVFVVIMISQMMIAVMLFFTDIPPPSEAEMTGDERPFRVIARQPTFIVALLSAMVGYGVMNFVMLATPIFMEAHPTHSFGVAAINNVIMWHVVGMYLPSFLTGSLIKRYGDLNIITIGVIICVASVAVNLSGDSIGHLRIAMALVGVGWNFMFTAGTTLLLQTYSPAEKAKIQGINDFFVFGTVALCSLLAGLIFQGLGWAAVNLAAIPLLVIAISSIVWLRGRRLAVAA